MSTPSSGGRFIDPRGHRFGAILSVVILSIAVLLNVPVLVGLIGLALFVSAWFGTRYSALGKPWPYVRKAFRLGPPNELESEIPPRFAQALGSLGLGLAVIAFLVGLPLAAWALTIAVAALQAVLGVTGYCLGCRLYFLRWYAPGLFERFAR
ncbi:MAG: hypothetical protein QOH61_2713 [Chloroflexota bacterium]|jgi:uncharacterized membrane protein|nr:hypothetical protein [Chloroflexota bacterium]